MTNLKTIRLDNKIEEHENIFDSEIDIRTFDDTHILTILKNMLATIPDFKMEGKPISLSGGLLNYVWRIQGQADSVPDTLIAKWAPPFVASSPNVQLDQNRIFIEAIAMTAFSPGNVLGAIATDSIKLPVLYTVNNHHHMILMEDVCQCPDLETWLHELHSIDETKYLGKLLGSFIGKLHRVSAHIPALAVEFNNPKIQRTRLDLLYGNIFNYATRANIPDASILAERAVEFGRQLQLPGKTLIMGDLWPRSVIVSDNKLRIIDWELAHYGKPAQDIGHFAAHLWMLAHRAPTTLISENILSMLNAFLTSYKESLGLDFERVFGSEGINESSIHFGCEILARTVGLFQSGYVYDGLSVEDPATLEAVDIAASHIRSPSKSTVFGTMV